MPEIHIDVSNYAAQAVEAIQEAAGHASRPSVVYRPTLSADGDQWCVLLGSDLQSGVAGFGDTPDLAMIAFDTNFYNAKTPAASHLAGARPRE
jgi:hypothetical protein